MTDKFQPGYAAARDAIIASFEASAEVENAERLKEARRVGGGFRDRRSEDGWSDHLAERLAEVRNAYLIG